MMIDQQIQDIADRVIESLNNLAPSEPEQPVGWATWEGWDYLAPLEPFAPLLAALLIAGVAWRTLRQKRQADNRTEWWKRTQWALDATNADEPKMVAYGEGLLKLLLVSKMASKEDKGVLDAIWEESETNMVDDKIQGLVDEITAAGALTPEDLASLMSVIDDSQSPEDNGDTKEEH